MKKHIIFVVVFSLIILNYFYPYTLLTSIKIYNYKDTEQTREDGISVVLNPTVTETLIVPFLLKQNVYTSPYKYSFVIFGDYDDVENIHGYFFINNEKIDINNNIYRNDIKLKNVFDYMSKTERLDIKWDESTKIKFVVEFMGIKDGVGRIYKREAELKANFQEGLGNQLLWNLESI